MPTGVMFACVIFAFVSYTGMTFTVVTFKYVSPLICIDVISTGIAFADIFGVHMQVLCL